MSCCMFSNACHLLYLLFSKVFLASVPYFPALGIFFYFPALPAFFIFPRQAPSLVFLLLHVAVFPAGGGDCDQYRVSGLGIDCNRTSVFDCLFWRRSPVRSLDVVTGFVQYRVVTSSAVKIVDCKKYFENTLAGFTLKHYNARKWLKYFFRAKTVISRLIEKSQANRGTIRLF